MYLYDTVKKADKYFINIYAHSDNFTEKQHLAFNI